MQGSKQSAAILIALWILAPLVTLGLAVRWLNAPASELVTLAQILLVSETLSLALGYAIYRLSERLRLATVHLKIALTYALGLGVTLLNILFVSMPMFISEHDSTFLLVLIVFATLVALGFGYLMARSITGNLEHLARTAEKIADGDLTRRAQVRSGDEVEMVAAAFNRMVQQLDQMQTREKELEHARRSLVAAVSHDLRTPLTSLRAMIETINDGVVTDEASVRRYLLQAQSELENLSRLVDDLFELSQLDAAAPNWSIEPGSLRDLVSDTLESMRALAIEKDIALSGCVDPAVDPVPMNSFKVQRVLNNLVENAIRYTPRGGSVSVDAHVVDGAQVQVQVADTGEGIAESDLAHIFEPFYRGGDAASRRRDEFGGAGLGLAIAKGIVEAHNGQLTVETRRGEGSRFCFTLPKSH